MDLFIHAHQYGRIARAEMDATTAKNKVERSDDRLSDLERRVDRLALACQALWELLRERTDIEEAEVFAMMERIDLRDGRRDGKISLQTATCANCGRTINTLRPKCVYCGHDHMPPTIAH
jgi:predicted Zn-ribbon and HTH transcriptional regulator